MVITQEILDELFKLYEELNQIRELHSEQLKTVKDQFGDRHVKRINADGHEVICREHDLWEEIRFLGLNSQAAEILKGKYPDVFESLEKVEALQSEVGIFVLKHMGLNFTQMTLTDYIKLTLGLIDYAKNADQPTRKSIEPTANEVPTEPTV
jgi:hypothetical protein